MTDAELVIAIKRSTSMENQDNEMVLHIFMATMFELEKAVGKIEIFEKWMNKEEE